MRLLRWSERNELYGRKSQCVSHVMLGVVNLLPEEESFGSRDLDDANE